MYLPKHFEEPNAARVAALIDRYAFGLLVTFVDGRPYASHAPFLRASDDRLLCHLARANPQSRQIDGAEILAVFSGPHAYVSPSWYASPGVPTWNYATAHVYGRAKAITAHERLREIVGCLTVVNEAAAPEPWTPEYDASKLDHIVGIEIEVTEIQGKFKLSQNRPAEDRNNVIEQLRARASDNAMEVAALMAENRAQRLHD